MEEVLQVRVPPLKVGLAIAAHLCRRKMALKTLGNRVSPRPVQGFFHFP